MHGEVSQIRAKVLNAPWPKYLRALSIAGLRGWAGQEVRFNFPVCAISGENGSGKSTVLKAAAVAYNSAYFPASFFVDSAWEQVTGVTIDYKIKEGHSERNYSIRKPTERWRMPERPRREVIWQDISRTLPLDATAGYARIAKRNSTEASASALSAKLAMYYSAILGRKYDSVKVAHSSLDATRPVGVVEFGGKIYSQYHQGAGEDATLDLMLLLQDVHETSLVLIDEVEASLHPRAQRRLVHFLLWLARTKNVQVILSTHSSYVIEELPPEARIFLNRSSAGIDVFYGISSNYALSRMDDIDKPDLYIFTEDEMSSQLLREILRHEGVELARLRIMAVGPADMVGALGRLAKGNRLPVASVGALDGDQSPTDGCISLPGQFAPERQLFQDVLATAVPQLARRIGVPDLEIFDALSRASVLPDHHDWPKNAADELKQSSEYFWATMCQVWTRHCMSAADGESLAAKINAKLLKE